MSMDNDSVPSSPPHTGRLLSKIVVGTLIMILLWVLFVQETRFDPVRQIMAAISHVVHPDQPVDFDDLAAQIASEEDRAFFRTAIERMQRGNYTSAARELTLLSQRHAFLAIPLGRHYVSLAEELIHEGDMQRANECLRISIDYFTRHSGRAHLLLATTYENLGRPNEAQRHRELARSLETSRSNAPYDPIGLFLSLGLTLTASLVVGALLSVVFSVAPNRGNSSSDMSAKPGELPTFWTAPDTTSATEDTSGPEKKYGSITKVLTAEERLEQVKVLFEEKLYEDAYAVFRKAASLNPAVSKKITKMCIEEGVRLYDDDETRAAELFEVALQHDPHNLLGHTYLANCCIKLNLFDKAVEHYLAVVRINPDNATGYYNLGICYNKIGDVPNALRAFTVATEKEDLPNAHFYLAKLSEATGDKAAAIRHWKRCLELAPDTPQGKRARERLAAISGGS